MKKLFIFIYLVFISMLSFSQWTTLNSGIGTNLNSTYFLNDHSGYTTGASGKLLQTTDGGTNWATKSSGTSNNLNSISYDNTNIWIVGDNGTVIKYSGSSEVQTIGTQNLNSVFFVNSTTGYVAGNNGTILKTTNGGNNWSTLNSATYNNLNSVYFTDINTGYAVGNQEIYKTTNGGTNWSYQTISSVNLKSVYFTDANTGYAVGNSGTIVKTTNAGVNWSAQTSPITTNLNSVYFINANNGYIVGDAGKILKTTNAGTNWTLETSPTSNNLYSVYFANTVGYAVGAGGTILKYSSNVSVNENKSIDFNIYPNPIKTNSTITITSNENINSVSIYNMKGEQVLFRKFNENSVELNLNLSIGMYLVKINENSIKKIIVQ